jgi:hypothetical protein
MAYLFPTLDSLALALTSGAIPATVAAASALAAVGEEGTLVFADLSAAAAKRLRQLGIDNEPDDGRPRRQFSCWPQLLPLVPVQPQVDGQTPVLFDVPGGAAFAGLVTELLRLGNDRQSYRHLNSGDSQRMLLRVIGPPYYTLLRSLEPDRSLCAADRVTAFVEQRPRIWVELGREHPLADRLQPPPGKWLLLRSSREWEQLDEGPLEEIYQAVDFPLPAAESNWHDQPLSDRMQVPLRLASMAETDPAELWVLEDDAQAQIEQLIAHSDNELIARLAFAVVTQAPGGAAAPLVLLRVRPSKLPPPVLILRGVACRSYLNLANLFVPVGRRLHPPLRRDVVGKLLAADANQLVWLHPGESGQFVPRGVSDSAFRPLSQWVDYVLDQAHEPLQTWMAAHRFDFASFICGDDAPQPAPRPAKEREARPAKTSQPAATKSAASTSPTADEEPVLAEIVLPGDATPAELARAELQPSELQQRLSRIESQFTELREPLESPARIPLWREMALLNGALDRRLDAALCWSHALWEQPAGNGGDTALWLADGDGDSRQAFPARSELEALLADPAPPRVAVTRLAAQLIRQAALAGSQTAPADQVALAARVLTQHENALPVRLAWLAAVAAAWLAQDDALALARARDRLLERLFQQGLTVEHDLPGFLRGGSGADAGRQRSLREQLRVLRDLVAEWIYEPPSSTARTRAYADLIFAFGLARLGEAAEAQRIVGWARQKLGSKDNVHAWAFQIFEHRIDEAAKGQRQGHLPAEALALLEYMSRDERYKVDRLRQRSRLIEPLERIDSFRNFHRRYPDEFSHVLAQLSGIVARDELHARLRELLSHPPAVGQTPLGRVRLIAKALELSPRVGEALALELLARVLSAWDGIDDVVERAVLLEKALLVAAHFDQQETMHSLLERFDAALPAIVGNYLHLQTEHLPNNQEKLENIESLFRQSLRGLRKLGLRDEIGRMFSRIVELAQADAKAPPAKAAGGRPGKRDPARTARLLLTVAGGWFYFGQHEQAQPVAAAARQQLFQNEMSAVQRSALACAYVAAVAQAPLATALPLIQELFGKHPQTQQLNLLRMVDPLFTSTHFSLAQLDLVEATVLTLVSDEFVLSPETRQWLEEDEFLVRRRIHRDVREMVGA